MGCGASKDANTAEIDKRLVIEDALNELNLKLLLLGPGESGKSTFLKQIKLIYDIKLTDVETSTLISSLKRNAAQCIQILAERAIAYEYDLGSDKELADQVLAYELGDDLGFTPDFVKAVVKLWQNESIRKTFERRSEYWILEVAPYYFENIERVTQDNFVPTEKDIVMTRVVTTGITSTTIEDSTKPTKFTIVDVGGQRNERRKWIHCFDKVKAILFVINLADYNNVLYEDALVNRMTEAVQLFSATVNNALFSNTPFFLLLNKKDLLETVIMERPLTRCEAFSDYTGGNTSEEAIEYIGRKLKGMVTSGSPDRVHVMPMAACVRSDIEEAWKVITAELERVYGADINNALKIVGK